MYNNRTSFIDGIPTVVKNLLILNVLFWLASITFPKMIGIELHQILGMHYFQASTFNPIQLFTYMFMHAGFEHLFFNMFSLYMFGRLLEQVWGEKKFLIFYFATGVGAGIIQQISWYIELRPFIEEINNLAASNLENGINIGSKIIYSAPELFAFKNDILNRFITVGASGSVFGLLLAFGMMFPNMQIFLFFIMPIRAKYFVILYGLIEFFAGVSSISGIRVDGVAHFAHLGGMLFGYILIQYWKKKRFL